MLRMRMHLRKLARRLIITWNIVVLPLAVVLLVMGHGWWALLAIMTAHALWLIPTLWPACDWCGEVVTNLPQGHAVDGAKLVWLTIDDGPDAEDTPKLLDLLDEHGVKATFFFIGEKAARLPEVVAEVVRRGHKLGNHTKRHVQYWFWAFGPGAVRREIVECQQVLEKAADGAGPQWFRAPAGLKNPWVHEAVENLGLRVACWSSRGLDGVDTDAARVMGRLKASLRPGAIMLMHEGRLDAQGERLAPQVLGEMLEFLKAEGYRCVLPESC